MWKVTFRAPLELEPELLLELLLLKLLMPSDRAPELELELDELEELDELDVEFDAAALACSLTSRKNSSDDSLGNLSGKAYCAGIRHTGSGRRVAPATQAAIAFSSEGPSCSDSEASRVLKSGGRNLHDSTIA
jgi:hypothetical protein